MCFPHWSFYRIIKKCCTVWPIIPWESFHSKQRWEKFVAYAENDLSFYGPKWYVANKRIEWNTTKIGSTSPRKQPWLEDYVQRVQRWHQQKNRFVRNKNFHSWATSLLTLYSWSWKLSESFLWSWNLSESFLWWWKLMGLFWWWWKLMGLFWWLKDR